MADRPAWLVTGVDDGERSPLAGTLGWWAAWITTALMGGLALTQVFGVTPWIVVFAAQAFTPYVLLVAAPLSVVAFVRGRRRLALVDVAIAVVILWLVQPVVFGPDAPTVPAGAPSFTILSANTLYTNPRPADAALAVLAPDADLLVITEYAGDLALQLGRDGASDRYPYRVTSPTSDRSGLALFSRFPILRSEREVIGDQPGIVALVAVHGTVIRVIVVHPLPGLDTGSLVGWHRALAAIDELATSPGPPTIVVGDFNSSRWHPAFRRLLDHLTDAHEQAGAGWSMSWPNDLIVPPFVRLDHALLDDHLVATHVDEIEVPGSDHRAFEASVSVLP